MSHAEEMAKIQERIFPERSALAAAAGLSDAISKSLSGVGNVGLDDDVLASLTGSTSKMTRQLNRDLHLGINVMLATYVVRWVEGKVWAFLVTA